MTRGVVFALMLVPFSVLFVAQNFFGGSDCLQRIAQWATQNNLRLQSAQRTWSWRTPWGLWGMGKGTSFFEITAVDATGLTRHGWIWFPASIVGAGGRMRVRWEQPPTG